MSAASTQPLASSVAALHCFSISELLGALSPKIRFAWATTDLHSLTGTGSAFEQPANTTSNSEENKTDVTVDRGNLVITIPTE